MPLNFFAPPRQAIGGHHPGLHLSHIPKTFGIPTHMGNTQQNKSQPSLLLLWPMQREGVTRVEVPYCSSSAFFPVFSLLNSTTCCLKRQEPRESQVSVLQIHIPSVTETQKRQREGRTSYRLALCPLFHGPCLLHSSPSSIKPTSFPQLYANSTTTLMIPPKPAYH